MLNSKSVSSNTPQAGIALLTVLALVATMSLAATFALGATASYVANLKSVNRQSTTYWEDRSAQSAGQTLYQVLIESTQGKLTDIYLAEQKPIIIPLPDGIATIVGFEASNCFNINVLGQSASDISEPQTSQADSETATPQTHSMSAVYIRLLTHLGVDEYTATSLHDHLADWTDSDVISRPSGAEDETYSVRSKSHNAGNRPFLQVSDLRVLEGYTTELIEGIAPYLCAYRADTPIVLNINTLSLAQAPLLAAMYSSELDVDTATQILSLRPTGGWTDVKSFKEDDDIALLDAASLNDAALSISSSHIGFEMQLDTGGITSVYRYVYGLDSAQKTTLMSRRKIG